MSDGKIDLSIIIISYNTKKITSDCLNSVTKSLKDSSISYEIIVVDNASTDGSTEMLKNHNLVINKTNVGFAKANNQGVKQAKGNYILFLNSDILVLDDAIDKLYTFFKQNKKTINFLGGKLLNKDMSPQPSAGPFYSLPMIFGALFLRGDYWGLTRYSPVKIKEVDWISGACILTTKHAFNDIGGFDENIFMYMDEIDLLYRARNKGYRVFFYPEARFIHLGSASSGGRSYPILQVYHGFLYFYKKHHSVLALRMLIFMLKLKALIGLVLGHIFNNKYLKETYEKAYKLSKMD